METVVGSVDVVEVGSLSRRGHVTFQMLLDAETAEVPAALRSTSQVDLGSEDVSKERYYSREYQDREADELWGKVWQLACRIEDIPEVGDTVLYEVAHHSILVVRSAPDTISAYPNACLHRGAQLRTCDGRVPELRCPFHGYTWELDGSFKSAPALWDFPSFDPDTWALPSIACEVWEGFVFVNPDPDCVSLGEYLGELPGHVETIAQPMLRDRYKAIHVAKPLRSNWKVALEAFIEAYHVLTTHPQTVTYTGDENTQYDVYPGQRHWTRMITPLGTPISARGKWRATHWRTRSVRWWRCSGTTLGRSRTARSSMPSSTLSSRTWSHGWGLVRPWCFGSGHGAATPTFV
jgi:phenylpropionate dioxygenase-like ring-hydroxylating dioxygenase large terminal subunit